jgi:hypothetical protein
MEVSSMQDTILVALVGVGSTIIRATIGAATSYLVAKRNERTTEKRDATNRLIEIKRAARLIHAELIRLGAAASTSVESGTWYDQQIAKLSTDVWEKYSPTLAPELTYDKWLTLLVAYENVGHMALILSSLECSGQERNAISSRHLEHLEQVLKEARSAKSALASYTY